MKIIYIFKFLMKNPISRSYLFQKVTNVFSHLVNYFLSV